MNFFHCLVWCNRGDEEVKAKNPVEIFSMNTWANNSGWCTKTCKPSNQIFQKKQADVFCKGSCGCYLVLAQLPAAQPSKFNSLFFYSKAELYSHCPLESHNHYKRENKNQYTTCHSQGREWNLMTYWGNSVIFLLLKIKTQIGCFHTDRYLCQRGVFFISLFLILQLINN